MAGRTFIADKETLDKTHSNTDKILKGLEDKGIFKPKRFGYKIDKNDSNPNTRITYILDAEGFTPAKMNYGTGMFDYGSWANVWFIKDNFPCMLKYDGTVDYKLNPNDYSKKENGEDSDISNVSYGGNAMSAIPTIWRAIYEQGNYEYHIFCSEQYDESYHAYCHQRADGSIMKYRYARMFEGFFDGTRLRSLSGQTVTASQNGATEVQRAEANGSLWTTTTWNLVDLLKDLLTLISKSDDSQTSFGNGNCSNDNYLKTGQLNTSGQFYGYSTTDKAVKAFHIENWWGNYWERARGLVCNKGVVKAALYPPYSDDGAAYENTGITLANGNGYAKDTKSDWFGRIPINTGGSSSTYLCDYLYCDTSAITYLLFGGARSAGLSCGASYLHLNSSFTGADTNVAASLSCEEPLNA